MDTMETDAETIPVADDGDWGDVKPDAIQLLSGGRIFLRFDSAEYSLRGPNNRFLRDLQEEVQDLLDAREVALGDVGGMQERILAEADGDNDRIAELVKSTRADLESKVNEVRDGARIAIANIVNHLEATGRLVDEADLPPWCEQVDLITDMIVHWRRVPKDPGA